MERFCRSFLPELSLRGKARPKLIISEPLMMSQRMLTAACVAIALVGVLEFKRIHDTDIFWQIKLGQIMLDEGRIPQFDRFTYTHSGEPAPPVGWLAQTLLASVYGLGGWHLARVVHHCALIGSLVFAAATSQRDQTSPLSVALAMMIGFLVMLSNADLRPQSLGLLSFAALLAVARSPRSLKIKLIVAAPLVIAWQNMHPSVLVGAVALAGLCTADSLDSRRGQSSPWQMVVLTLLTAAAQLATPILAGVFDVSRSNLRISRDLLHLAEWVPPWDPKVVDALGPFWLALLASLIAIVWLWAHVSWRDRALFIVMTILALYAARFIIFWAVALLPFWAQVVERIVPIGMFTWARDQRQRSVHGGLSTVGLCAAAAIVFGTHPARFLPIVDPEIPLNGVQALRAHLPAAARIYNDYIWAGPLILDSPLGWRVAVDGRLYFFPDPAEWRSIADASAGRISLEELERKHRPDAFFLYPARNQALVRNLSTCPRWRACFRGPTCAAFVRAR
jgi:hypothetical protein